MIYERIIITVNLMENMQSSELKFYILCRLVLYPDLCMTLTPISPLSFTEICHIFTLYSYHHRNLPEHQCKPKNHNNSRGIASSILWDCRYCQELPRPLLSLHCIVCRHCVGISSLTHQFACFVTCSIVVGTLGVVIKCTYRKKPQKQRARYR